MSHYKPTFEERLARLHMTTAVTPRCAKNRAVRPMTTVERELSMPPQQPAGVFKTVIEASTLSSLLLLGFVL